MKLPFPQKPLTKVNVARRHLRAAIRMFLDEQDPVPIYTLACAAQDVLRDLLRAKGEAEASFIKDSDLIKPEHLKEYREISDRPRNFFKHADRDPDGVLEFQSEMTAFVIHDCAFMYRKLTGRALREGEFFCLWFAVRYPQFVKPGPFAEAVRQAKGDGVGSGPMGRRAFLELMDRPELQQDAD